MKSIKVDEFVHAELRQIKYVLGEASLNDTIKRIIRHWRIRK